MGKRFVSGGLATSLTHPFKHCEMLPVTELHPTLEECVFTLFTSRIAR